MTDKKRDLTDKEIEDLIIGIAKPTFEFFMDLVKKKSRKLGADTATNINMISVLISCLGSIESNTLAFIGCGLVETGAIPESATLILKEILHKMRSTVLIEDPPKDLH